MKRKILSALTITALLAAMLGAGGLVYADSHADAHATADSQGASTSASACHDAYAEASALKDSESSSSINEGYPESIPPTNYSYVYAEATSVSNGYADSDVYVYVGDTPYEGKIVGYAVSNATGTGSYADSNINIGFVIPAGVYFDADANGNAYAIALLLSDGSTVWGFAVTNSTGGEGARANVEAVNGILVEAVVGIIPK
ncbi:MAG: hypothetical protein ACRKGH_04795 [Dehalogenimonas sp.]